MPEIPLAYSFSGQQIEDPLRLLRAAEEANLPTHLWLGKANRFTLPKGRAPGQGWVLMLQSSLQKIDLNKTDHILVFEQGGSDATKIEIKNLIIIKAETIYGPGVITPETLYLVEVVDKRHLFFLSAINKDYNLLSPDDSNFFDDSLNSGEEWTWQEVLDDLWDSLPDVATSTEDNEESAPQFFPSDAEFLLTTNPENLRFRGISTWEAINQVLDRLHFDPILHPDGKLQYSPKWSDDEQSSTFSAATTTASTLEEFLDERITRGLALDVALPQQGTVPRLPETVRIFFPSREAEAAAGESYLLERSAETVDVTTLSILPNAKTSPGTVKIIWDETEAIFDSGSVQNQAALNTRATEVATAFLQSDPSEQFDSRLYSGLLQIIPGTFAAFVAWGDTGQGMLTEIGKVLPPFIIDEEEEPLERPQYELDTPCGDLLAGWTPNQTNDSDEPNDAGTAVVTLTSDDVPTFGTNTVNRVPGYVNPFAWRFNAPGSVNPLMSTLWANDSPDFVDVTEDFSVQIVWKQEDLAFQTLKYLWDMRGSVSMRVANVAAVERFQVLAWTNPLQTFTYAGLTVEEDVWYVTYLRYSKNDEAFTVSVTKLEDVLEANRTTLDAFQDFALPGKVIDYGATLGFFIGESAEGLNARGMRGFVDGHLTWQKNLPDCQIKSAFNRGTFRTLPPASPFQDGKGKIRHREFTGYTETTDGSTVNLIAVPIPDDTVVCVNVNVTAFRTDAANESAFSGLALFARRGAGAATLTGFIPLAGINNIGGTASIGAAVSGNNGIITVTGRIGRSINWHGEAFLMPAF